MFGLSASLNVFDTKGQSLAEPSQASAVSHGKQDIVTVRALTRNRVETYMQLAQELRTMPRREVMARRQGAIVASLFYEPSTRTRLSFETAALRLGARVVGAENALENSSAKKGERLEDTLRIVGSYADAIVVRHHENNTLAEVASLCPVPVVSAGTGAGEHPTQALLDVYTLERELGRVDGLHISILGDLRYGRTVHSLLYLLTQFNGVVVTMFAVPGLELPSEMAASLAADGLRLRTVGTLEEALSETDAVYQTRIQRERLQGEDALSLAGLTHLGVEELRRLPSHARILHPLPRLDELNPELDHDPRAAYFRQAENGLFIRMAVLDSLLKEGIS
ncbi:aspartate carbamoyltransferase [Alicyclobacillus ferrooxydans]|uniref:aspartate carbamoyltransferase n=1 Tax=Alicyclobacillus ferrooxydans TaxID=471514 RepID=UPI001FE2055F|nr:aspartate carbamoyltransferase [Alicyclobacillus ferrooxydans]